MLIKRGSTGEKVKQIQEKLGLKSDGQFGPITESKVKEWQTKNGLTANGVVDQSTWDKLFPSQPTNNTLNLDRLKGHVPDLVIQQIPEVMSRFRIDTPLRLAHFLAQCAHESGGFRATTENLSYSADRLLQIFPKYFKSLTIANSYARNQEKIANRVYASRMGNGPESSGDGWRYRGRGYIQLTGRSNYTAFDAFVDDAIIENPDLVSTKFPLLSAGWFWHRNKLNLIADAGFSSQNVEAVTRRVNGGTHGLSDRLSRFNQIYNLLK